MMLVPPELSPNICYRCYHVSEGQYTYGDIIKKGRWGAIIKEIGDKHQHFAREQLLERIRMEFYPEKVSRLSCLFVWPTLEQGDRFHQVRWKDQRCWLYEVIPTVINPKFTSAWMYCLPPLDEYTDEEAAHEYWKGKLAVHDSNNKDDRPQEILLDSDVFVLWNCAETA